MHFRTWPLGPLMLLSLFACGAQVRAGFPDIVWVGAATNYVHVSGGGTNKVVFHFTNGVCEIVPYAADVVRVHFDWENRWWSKDDIAIAKPLASWPAVATQVTNPGPIVEIRLPELVVEVTTGFPFRVSFKDINGVYLLKGYRWEYDPIYNPITDHSYTGLSTVTQFPIDFRIKSILEMPTNEAYFGLGEYAGPLNRRGLDWQGWNSDDYSWVETKNPLYKSFPFVYGVRAPVPGQAGFAYGLFFNNPSRPVFRLGTQSQYFGGTNVWSFEAGEGQLDYFFFGGGPDHTMNRVLQRYAELTGPPTLLPKWAFGYHLSRWSYDSQSWVEWLANTFANDATNNFPLDAIYLDIDYMDFGLTSDGYYRDNLCRQLQFNGNFPTPSNLVSYCAARGVKLVPIVEPWINRWHPGLFDEASNLGHFVEYNNGSPAIVNFFFGEAAFLDFTSTACRDWWRGKLVNFLNQYPFQGIWNDLSEPADTDGSVPDLMGRDALYSMDGRFGSDSTNRLRQHITVKNTYAVWETSCTYTSLLERFPDRRPFVLTRAGWPGIQRYALGWSGDNKYTYDHLRCNIRLGNSVMISGQANYGHDVGGFSGQGDPVADTTPELMTRWHQWGVLNPLCRNHSAKWNMQREPFRFDRDHYNWMKDSVQFRYALSPYLYTLAYDSSITGVPMNAPTVFYFQTDSNTFSQNDYEIMVGDGLLAAPVYTEGARSRTVYLPAGATWYSWHDGSKFVGGQSVTVPAPEGRLPLFARSGAIIPMGPPMQYMNQFQPDFVDVHVWPATNLTEFTLFEDDGESWDYRSGDYAKSRFASQRFSDRWVGGVSAREGSYNPYLAGTRALYFIGYDIPPVLQVALDGSPLARFGTASALRIQTQGWAYDGAARKLTVKVPETGGMRQFVASFVSPADSDNDGMPDWWELAHSLNPVVNDASGNADGDSRNNLAEYHAAGDPQVADTFASAYSTMSIAGTFDLWDPAARQMKLVGNQVWAAVLGFTNVSALQFKFAANDGWSLNWGDNNQSDLIPPTDQTADSDGANIALSGALNGVYTFTFNESSLAYSIYPAASRDSDGDGIHDEEEYNNGLNPLSRADGVEDADGDGAGNAVEAVAGTSEIDPSSRLWLTPRTFDPSGRFSFAWERVGGRWYDVFYSTNLSSWQPLPGLSNLSGSGSLTVTDEVSSVQGRSYKVQVRKP